MNEPLKIKVCGMRDPSNIEEVCRLRPDLIGYIFYRDSRRYVGDQPDPAIFRIPPPEIGKTGVFVNEEIDQVQRIHEHCRLQMVQLHGTESPGYCRKLKEQGIDIIKVFKPDSLENDELLEEYSECAVLFLFDSPGKMHGGTGIRFNWDLLEGKHIPLPFLLSGGIGPGDVREIRNLIHDSLFGIDLNSRFENAPGLKDRKLLKEFMEEIRK